MYRYQRFLLSLYVGMMFLLFSLLLVGPRGVVDYGRRVKLRDRLLVHVELMEAEHHRLVRDLTLVRDDFSEIYLRARKLGYYQPGEIPIIFEDALAPSRPVYTNGQLTVRPFRRGISLLFYLCSLSVSLICFLFLSFFEKGGRHGYSQKRCTEYDALHPLFEAEPGYRRSV